jgi:hypothetical protein
MTLTYLERPWTTIVEDDGPVVALRERQVVAPGSLLDRRPLAGSALVNARDLHEREWWIPACGVWSDVDVDGRRDRPWPIGLASRDTRHVALLAALSDRLGWEAEVARRRGCQLPLVEGLGEGRTDDTTVYDGRLGHDVPTVVIVANRAAFWGAGATMPAAYHRALYGDRGELGGRRELRQLGDRLADAGIELVAVDLATAVMSERGVHRLSVQLMLPSHDPGRSWDADPVN